MHSLYVPPWFHLSPNALVGTEQKLQKYEYILSVNPPFNLLLCGLASLWGLSFSQVLFVRISHEIDLKFLCTAASCSHSNSFKIRHNSWGLWLPVVVRDPSEYLSRVFVLESWICANPGNYSLPTLFPQAILIENGIILSLSSNLLWGVPVSCFFFAS